MRRILIGAGIVLILVGLVRMVGKRLGPRTLPRDIVIERGNFRLYFPIATSLIVSVVISLVCGSSIADPPECTASQAVG
jgi:hypothetical protein